MTTKLHFAVDYSRRIDQQTHIALFFPSPFSLHSTPLPPPAIYTLPTHSDPQTGMTNLVSFSHETDPLPLPVLRDPSSDDPDAQTIKPQTTSLLLPGTTRATWILSSTFTVDAKAWTLRYSIVPTTPSCTARVHWEHGSKICVCVRSESGDEVLQQFGLEGSETGLEGKELVGYHEAEYYFSVQLVYALGRFWGQGDEGDQEEGEEKVGNIVDGANSGLLRASAQTIFGTRSQLSSWLPSFFFFFFLEGRPIVFCPPWSRRRLLFLTDSSSPLSPLQSGRRRIGTTSDCFCLPADSNYGRPPPSSRKNYLF